MLAPEHFGQSIVHFICWAASLPECAEPWSGYRPVALLDCEVIQGVVVPSGVVPSFYMKQIAQTVILRLESVNGLENRVEVQQR
jgi:hypothetical protein